MMINKETTTTYTPFISVNQVRLIDVFVIAPFLIYVGTKKELPKNVRLGLTAIGVATLLFNANNYLKNKQ